MNLSTPIVELLFKEASEVDDFTIRCQAALDHATGPTHIGPKITNCILSIIPGLKPQEVDYGPFKLYYASYTGFTD